jgi:hypothetical protein
VEKRQRVKYLGSNERQAIEIQSVLEKLQQVRNFDKQIREITRKANLLLRETKRRLEPLISEAGWKFHGRAIRRSDRRATNINKAICEEANHGNS